MAGYEGVMISDKYRRGSALIYDCTKGFYACVSFNNFDQCQEQREEEKAKFTSVLSCAPLKKYDTIGECEQTQREVIHRLIRKEFCYMDTRERQFRF